MQRVCLEQPVETEVGRAQVLKRFEVPHERLIDMGPKIIAGCRVAQGSLFLKGHEYKVMRGGM